VVDFVNIRQTFAAEHTSVVIRTPTRQRSLDGLQDWLHAREQNMVVYTLSLIQLI
jgi:hypothetical protein